MDRNLYWHLPGVSQAERVQRNRHRAGVVWFTGLSNAGKSTIAHALERVLFDQGCHTFVFDGDNVRHGLCADLGFSADDRHENIRRIGEMARLFMEAGVISLAAFISPYRADRDRLRDRIGRERFMEIYCRCSIAVCENRDQKGIYRKARAGEIRDFTGISAPYEEPVAPDLVLDTEVDSVNACVDRVHTLLQTRGIVTGSTAHI
ncbi:MAG: adenylyl-sulfate kinase [Burkholderiales bacterium]|nr:adenylyl-sulfate kinase [Burkholderiales bacterium]